MSNIFPEDILRINKQNISFDEIFEKDSCFKNFGKKQLSNKTILITGGAGSIGKVLLREILSSQDIKKVIIIDI